MFSGSAFLIDSYNVSKKVFLEFNNNFAFVDLTYLQNGSRYDCKEEEPFISKPSTSRNNRFLLMNLQGVFGNDLAIFDTDSITCVLTNKLAIKAPVIISTSHPKINGTTVLMVEQSGTINHQQKSWEKLSLICSMTH